jgi:hypothetical protein
MFGQTLPGVPGMAGGMNRFGANYQPMQQPQFDLGSGKQSLGGKL